MNTIVNPLVEIGDFVGDVELDFSGEVELEIRLISLGLTLKRGLFLALLLRGLLLATNLLFGDTESSFGIFLEISSSEDRKLSKDFSSRALLPLSLG